jgi:N-acetylmuramoyl-L-alanine amidase
VIERFSPNHDARPPGQSIDILLLHYTGMRSADAALDRLCDPDAKVSAHYLVDEDGETYLLVPESRRAWHAGVAGWGGARDINARSIGIELVNPGHEWGYRPFPPAQMQALGELADGILRRHPIAPQRVLAHSDVAPARRQDPGELFDWAWLAARGIGLWRGERPDLRGRPADMAALTARLKRYGYGQDDAMPSMLVGAFQRHFRPSLIDGEADAECLDIAEDLLRQAGSGP